MSIIKRISIIIILSLFFPAIVNAAGGISVSTRSVNVEPNGSKNFTISASNAAGRVDITNSNPSVATISSSSEFLDNNSVSVTVTGKSVGTTIIKVITTDVATYDLEEIRTTYTITVTVSAPNTTKQTTTTTTTTNRKTTTTRKNNNVNPTKGTTPTTALITTPILEPLKLTSVTVDDFEVTYNNGVYYVTTESYTESVTISATSTEGVTIVGTGVRKLSPGRNVVELVLRNLSTAQVNTYQVIITRPDDTANHDTKLTGLKVVNYGFAFSPDTYEYTIKVPYDVEEIYIIGETLNDDVNIAGVGLKSLTKGNNKIYIKVSYGNTESTDYVINIKRSYTKMVLIILSIVLGISLIGAIVYALINRKAAMEAKSDKKNREMAEMNRQINATTANIQVNGQNVVGVGRKTVIPTRVVNVKTPSAQTGPGITKTVVTQNMGPRVQVVRTNPQGYENKMVIDNLEDK